MLSISREDDLASQLLSAGKKILSPFFSAARERNPRVFFRVALFFRDKAGKESMANTITIDANESFPDAKKFDKEYYRLH